MAEKVNDATTNNARGKAWTGFHRLGQDRLAPYGQGGNGGEEL